MGFLQFYALLLLKNPYKILLGGVIFVFTLTFIALYLRPIPSFKDPLIGFEARDTIISARLNTWNLLFDETSAIANNLSLAQNSLSYENNHHGSTSTNNEVSEPSERMQEPPIIEMSTQYDRNASMLAVYIPDEEDREYYQSINSTKHLTFSLVHHSLGSSRAFCGKLFEGYAQIVIAPSSRQSSSGLFNLNSMIAICQLDRRLRLEHSIDDNYFFQKDCERFQNDEESTDSPTSCCNSWSLPNYIACLNNKTSCTEITSQDIKNTEQLINLCAPHFLRAPYEECFNNPSRDKASQSSTSSSFNILSSLTYDLNYRTRSHCGIIPEKCLKCDGWAYTVLYYLVNDNFIQSRVTNETNSKLTFSKQRINNSVKDPQVTSKLTLTNIFLPLAKSSTLLKYYHILSKYNLKTSYAQVKAMDLGLKNSLFAHLITDDAKLFIIVLITILTVFSIYTWSIVISTVVLMIICLSLCLSYTIYVLLLDIPVFPFMNLLAVVISFGICSDNAMLFCKHWTSDLSSGLELESHSITNPNDKIIKQEKSNLDRVFKRAIISTFVATIATACSFIISAISKVIAIRCFCIFATLSVITNYLLIVVLLPPALVIDSRFSRFIGSHVTKPQAINILKFARHSRKKLLELEKLIHTNLIFKLVTNYKFYLIVTFIALLSCASILVFHRPKLQPSDEDEVPLLSRKHAFEQYDRNIRKQFIFERIKSGESASTTTTSFFYEAVDTLPLRIVFGVKPIDNGNHLDPHERGSLSFDSRFDLADPNVQIWLLEFCRKLKQQRFLYPASAPNLSNCFIETFKSWMETRSCRDPIHTDHDRSPCCQSYEFPYSRYVLNRCIGEAINIIRKTPEYHPNINAGIRFFKNSTKVAAVIIEYQSNRFFSHSFSKMDRFFNEVDSWVTWQINNTAPPGLKSGWFISSNLEMLALQLELEQSTTTSILLEVAFAIIALMVGTRDLVLTLAGTLAIGTIIIVTVAVLIVLKWTLGVVESVLISLTIGLSIDFALHYSIAYSESRKYGIGSSVRIVRILDEVGSPIALATTTTSLAGFIIIRSDIMAYQELGVFLIVIALTSWVTSTFFLLPMLTIIGSLVELGEMYTRLSLRLALKSLIDRL